MSKQTKIIGRSGSDRRPIVFRRAYLDHEIRCYLDGQHAVFHLIGTSERAIVERNRKRPWWLTSRVLRDAGSKLVKYGYFDIVVNDNLGCSHTCRFNSDDLMWNVHGQQLTAQEIASRYAIVKPQGLIYVIEMLVE